MEFELPRFYGAEIFAPPYRMCRTIKLVRGDFGIEREGLHVRSPAKPQPSEPPNRGTPHWRRIEASVAGVLALALILVLATVFWPRTSPQQPAPPINFGLSTVGDISSGWAYLVHVHVVSTSEESGPIIWRNLTIDTWYQTDGGPLMPYAVPANTTLQVFAPSDSISPPYGPLVAEYNVSASRWVSGASALVEDGQWLALQGRIRRGSTTPAGCPGSSRALIS